MILRLITLLILSVVVVSCGDINSVDRSSSDDQLRPIPAFSTVDFSAKEQAALHSLCTSFQNMNISFGAKHEFSYKKDSCSESQESYTITLQVDAGNFLPVYSSAGSSLFFFPEIRYDLETNHPVSTFCNRINAGNNNRFIPDETSNGIRHTLEVISGEELKTTAGCYDSTMLGANQSNSLVCLRLWAEQVSGSIIQKLSHETITFVVSNALNVHSGFTVHREKHNYVQCTDKKKSLVYKANRLK